MRFYFTKMQGLGNDYVYLDCFDERMQQARKLPGNRKEELAVRMSRRHTGIGADGLIFILPSERADCRMEMYNADGSRGAMCGNGIRCVARYVVEKGIVKKRVLSVETDSGIREVLVRGGVKGEGETCRVRVDMGGMENRGERRLGLKGRVIPVQLVSAGNPHCVIFTEDIRNFPLGDIAGQIQCMPEFAEGINVEIAAVEMVAATGEKHIDMRVFERGIGETMACGTGACAVCAAAVWQGYCRYDENMEVRQPGGNLVTAYLADGRMLMEGPAEFVYEGVWDDYNTLIQNDKGE
ncbi:MAG: diaminopimelate epimerase [Coprococcus sp.]